MEKRTERHNLSLLTPKYPRFLDLPPPLLSIWLGRNMNDPLNWHYRTSLFIQEQFGLKMLGFINHISMKYGWFLVKMYDWKCEFISFLRRHNCLQLFGCYQSHQIYLKRISICLDIHVCEFVPLDYFVVFQCIWLPLPLLRPEKNGRLHKNIGNNNSWHLKYLSLVMK